MIASPEEAMPVIFIMLGVGFLVLGAVAFIREDRSDGRGCTGTILILVGAVMFLGAGLCLYVMTEAQGYGRTGPSVTVPAYVQDYVPDADGIPDMDGGFGDKEEM